MKFLRNYSLRDNSDYETEDKGTDLCVMSLVLRVWKLQNYSPVAITENPLQVPLLFVWKANYLAPISTYVIRTITLIITTRDGVN